jgi:predicted ATP-grasp superfamily ATP-dependent carboligase
VSAAAAPRALVTDGEQRAALAACRGLAAAGYDVAAAAAPRTAVCHWSRAVRERIRLPEPREQPAAYLDALAHALADRRFDVLLCGSEASLLPISEHRSRFEPFVSLGLPSHETLVRALDKHALLEHASAVGLPPPKSVVCTNAARARVAATQLGFPVLVKPSRSFLESGEALRQEVVRIARDRGEVGTAAAAVAGPCTIQAFDPDAKVVSCSGVRVEGRLLASGVCRYLRTWPARAGNASLAVTIEPPSGLLERVEQLLERIGWDGIFELELLETSSGALEAIDLNPRVFGQMAIMIAAGANMPAVWCDHVLGRAAAEPARARPGVVYRWEDAELKNLVWQLGHGYVRAGLSVLRPHRRVVHAHARASDPAPLLARSAYLVRQIPRRARLGR